VLARKLSEFKPDVAGLSIRNIDTTQRFDIFYYFETVRPTARLIRETVPGIVLLAGGAGFSMFAEKIMERVPEFDFGVYLEGEESVPDLLAHLDAPGRVKGIFARRENGVPFFSGPRDLPDFDRLPMPVRDRPVMDIRPYLAGSGANIGVQTKRGCMLECAYCSYPFLTGRKIRLRDPRKVVDEIEYLLALGVQKFAFVDNIFNLPVSHAEGICREIIRRKLCVEWSGWFEIKNTSRDLMVLARDAGCRHFGFSPDACTNGTLSALRKGITDRDLAENLRAVRSVKGIRAAYGFFVMVPGMTIGSLLKTLFLVVKIPVLLFGRGGAVFLRWIRIEPHTEIHNIALREGLLDGDTDLLPESESGIERLFYTRHSYRFVEVLLLLFVRMLEDVVKPAARKARQAVLGRRRNAG